MTTKKPSNRDKLDLILQLLLTQRQTGFEPLCDPLRDTLLFQLLYAAVVRFGVVLPNPSAGGVISSLQVAMLDIPAEHDLSWQELENGTILIQIIATPEGGSTEAVSTDAETAPTTEMAGSLEEPQGGSSSQIFPPTAGEVNQEGTRADAAAHASSPPAPAKKTPSASEQLALPLDPVAELEAIEDVEMAEMIEESRK